MKFADGRSNPVLHESGPATAPIFPMCLFLLVTIFSLCVVESSSVRLLNCAPIVSCRVPVTVCQDIRVCSVKARLPAPLAVHVFTLGVFSSVCFVFLLNYSPKKKRKKEDVVSNEEPEALCGSEAVVFVYFDIEYVMYNVAIVIT